jgi:predicted amidohydrolase
MTQPGNTGMTFRAALVQLRSSRDPNVSIAEADPLIREGAARADYVLTPENTSLMELRTEALFTAIDREEDTAALRHFRDLAAALHIWLHIGSLPVLVEERRAANRSFLIAPDGEVAARYDKIHMFDVDLDGGESYRESRNYRPGGEAVLADLPWGRLGLTTCYDLRFPEQYLALAQAGADFITVPSAFTRQTGAAHWHVLLRARAIETGCFVLAAAQGGCHDNGRETYGHSLIVGPWGEIIAEIPDDEPGVIVAEIDPRQVALARQKIPALNHRGMVNLALPEGPD